MRVLGLLRLAPWRRGPGLLLRRPGVALALAAAAFVATVPAAAAPLFLSSAQNAALHRQLAATCQWSAGARAVFRLSWVDLPTGFGLRADDLVRERRAQLPTVPGLTGPVHSLVRHMVNAELLGRPSTNPKALQLDLVYRDGLARHLRLVAGPVGSAAGQVGNGEGPSGNGVWLPDTVAAQQGIRVGDRLRLDANTTAQRGRTSGPYQVTVEAIYRDLRSEPDAADLCTLRDIYRGTPEQALSEEPVLPMAVLGFDGYLAAAAAMHMYAEHWMEYAVAEAALPAGDAPAVIAGIDRLRTQVVSDREPFVAVFPASRTFQSEFGHFVRRSDLVRRGLLPPVVPITAAGVLVGLTVVAAAALFWVLRRRQELTILAAHGIGPGGLGLKAVVEALPAVLFGAAAGTAAAWALVRFTGPSPVLSAGARPLGAIAAAVAAGACMALIGVAATAGCRTLADAPPPHRRRRWARAPWELVLLAAAPVAWHGLSATSTVDTGAGGTGEVAHLPARLLVVPILVIAGAAMLGGRLAAGHLRRRGLQRTPSRPARLLAWRRTVRDAAATAVLAGATALPIATATYGATVTDSIRTTTDAEVRMALGSDVVATLDPDSPVPALPASLARHATEVTRIDGRDLGGITVDVLAIDPATFAAGAFWDRRIDGPALADALQALDRERSPAVVASALVPTGESTLRLLTGDLPVRVAATRLVPGAQGGYPALLIRRDAAPPQPEGRRQLWIRGDPQRIRVELAAARVPVERVVSIDELRVGALYEPVAFTFQYLVALSVFTALITVVGLLLYLESRLADRRRGYVLLRRLGLRGRAHRNALLLELGAPVIAGLAGGLGIAIALGYGLGNAMEINRAHPPDTLVALPWRMAGAVALAALAIGGTAALLTHARIRRAHPSEVLRDVA